MLISSTNSMQFQIKNVELAKFENIKWPLFLTAHQLYHKKANRCIFSLQYWTSTSPATYFLYLFYKYAYLCTYFYLFSKCVLIFTYFRVLIFKVFFGGKSRFASRIRLPTRYQVPSTNRNHEKELDCAHKHIRCLHTWDMIKKTPQKSFYCRSSFTYYYTHLKSHSLGNTPWFRRNTLI